MRTWFNMCELNLSFVPFHMPKSFVKRSYHLINCWLFLRSFVILCSLSSQTHFALVSLSVIAIVFLPGDRLEICEVVITKTTQ